MLDAEFNSLFKFLLLRGVFVFVLFVYCRFWDLAYPERSYIVAGSSSSPSVSYYRKIIEGTEVVQVHLLWLLSTHPISTHCYIYLQDSFNFSSIELRRCFQMEYSLSPILTFTTMLSNYILYSAFRVLISTCFCSQKVPWTEIISIHSSCSYHVKIFWIK